MATGAAGSGLLWLSRKVIRLGSNRLIELPTEAVRLPVVFITGPRHSGTAAIGRFLARVTGRAYVGEATFGATDYERMQQRARRKAPCVVQAPALAPRILELPDNWLIVMVRRPLEAILRSVEDVNMPSRSGDLTKQYRELFPHCDCSADASDAEMIYQIWEEEQEPLLSYPFEVSYEAAVAHPGIVLDDHRAERAARRVAVAPVVSSAEARKCEPCSCSEPGYCDRHKRQKTPHLWKLCQTRPEYRALWDKQCLDPASSS